MEVSIVLLLVLFNE